MMPAEKELLIEDIEMELLLTALKKMYHVDFFNYRQAHIRRRILTNKIRFNMKTISEMTEKVLRSTDYAKQLLDDLSINVTDMFRFPPFYNDLRTQVMPMLKTFPNIKVWIAGCSSGEEVLSLAIILYEENLLNRTSIIATDFNAGILEKAKSAIYDSDKIIEWTENYNLSGGKNSFSDYYEVNFGIAKFNENLLKKVRFIEHNLMNENSFGKMHLILCRNVLIYFDKTL